jgi:hypothetical protein
MSSQSKIIVSVIVLAAAFAAGRQSVPEKVKTEIKTVEVEKIVTVVKKEVVTIVENPDGSKQTTIVTDTRTDSQTNTNASNQTTEETKKNKKLNVSILAGTSPSFNLTELVYGASISKEVVGPVTVGAWALTNRSVGISVGLNF